MLSWGRNSIERDVSTCTCVEPHLTNGRRVDEQDTLSRLAAHSSATLFMIWQAFAATFFFFFEDLGFKTGH